MSKYNVVKLENVVLNWARILEPVDTYMKDGKEYSVEAHMDDANMQKLLDAGLSEQVFNPNTEEKQDRFKTDSDTGLRFIKLKKRARIKNGVIQNPAMVFLADGKTPVTASIGNGSIANVDVILSEIRKPQPDGTFKGTGKLKATLGVVRVTDFVEYESNKTNEMESFI